MLVGWKVIQFLLQTREQQTEDLMEDKVENILVTELQDEILGLAGYYDAVRWRTVCKRWNKIIDGYINTAKIKMSPEDRLKVALTKLKLSGNKLTADQNKVLADIFTPGGVTTFLSRNVHYNMIPAARSILFIWFYVHDEYELFTKIVEQMKFNRPNRYDWFVVFCPELHFMLPYITMCSAPELDRLGIEIAAVVDQFLNDLYLIHGIHIPHDQIMQQHEAKYIELLERIFAMIKVATDNKISPDILTALQVLKSDLQPIENRSDRRPENLFVPICYFLNKVFVNVPSGTAKDFLRGNLSWVATQIVRKQIIDDIDNRIVDRFHSRVIEIFEGCLKGTPPVTYKIKDPIMPITPAIFIDCIDELLKAIKSQQDELKVTMEQLLDAMPK